MSSGDMDIGLYAWSSVRPILKLVLIMGVGATLSKRGILDGAGAKLLAHIIMSVAYPSLLFAKVSAGIDNSNLTQFGIMTVTAGFYIGLGWILGELVVKWTRPPVQFRHGAVAATAMGNFGDLTLAVVMSIGDSPPFSKGDAAVGIAYVSAFAFFSNLFSFTAGYVKIGRDFRSLDAPDETTLGTIQAHESDISVDTVQDPSCAPLNMIMTGPSGPSAVALIPNAVVETALPTFSPAPQDPQTQMPRSRPNGQRSARRRSGLLKMTRRVRGTLIPKAAQLKLSTETTFWIKNVMNLCNVSVVVGLIVGITPLRHLFFYDDPLAPPPVTKEPPLRVFYELFEFLGGAAVPLSILNLGGALGRLSAKTLLPLRVSASISLVRLVILPVVGIGLVHVLTLHTDLIDRDDRMLRFVMMFQACVPTASATVYLTQLWSPKGEANEIASVVLIQYPVAFITLTASLIVILILLS